MKETELYLPVKQLFETLGFEVEAEIEHIDIIAKKEDRYIAIELKKELNVHVIAQVLKRQTITDEAYIAIFKPSKKVFASVTFKDKILILKRLGIGLIFVDQQALIYKESEVVIPKKKRKNKKRLIETFQALNNENIGGSTQTKRMTLYKKQAIAIALCLGYEIKKSSQIKKETKIDKTYSILYRNYYNWFEALGAGMYQLKEIGKKINNL
jgi:hypothetical protein